METNQEFSADKKKDKRLKKAVALEYVPEIQSAPRVTAIGQGLIAEKIMELAEENGIPLREDPVLVDALSQLQPGEEIPPELYRAVAEILAFLLELDREA